MYRSFAAVFFGVGKARVLKGMTEGVSEGVSDSQRVYDGVSRGSATRDKERRQSIERASEMRLYCHYLDHWIVWMWVVENSNCAC